MPAHILASYKRGSFMNMDKEAQSRSPIKWLGRMLNPMEYVRYFGYDSYRRVYDSITEIDNDIRGRAVARKDELRDFLHQARMGMKNREYPRVMYYAWKILESMDGMFDRVDELELLRSEMMSEYYSSGDVSKQEQGEMERSLGKPVERPLAQRRVKVPTASVTKEGLTSTAGVTEWLEENIPTWRQMEGSMLDRIFRNKMYKQKEAARKALQMAEVSFKTIQDVFAALDSARTDFSAYLSTAQKAREKFNKQKNELSVLYNQYFQTDPGPVTVDQQPVTQEPTQPAPLPQEPTPQPILEETVEVPAAKAAGELLQLILKANTAIKKGEKKTAGFLLVKASEICDLYNNEKSAIRILKAAKRMLDD